MCNFFFKLKIKNKQKYLKIELILINIFFLLNVLQKVGNVLFLLPVMTFNMYVKHRNSSF